jgi:hypothetical protein
MNLYISRMPTHVFALEELSSNALAPLSVVSTIFLYQPHQQSTAPTIPSQTIPVDSPGVIGLIK